MDSVIEALFRTPVTHLIPAANFLVLAGLIFLGVAIVGRFSITVEPGTVGRTLCGLVGVALLGAGIAMLFAVTLRPPSMLAPTSTPTLTPAFTITQITTSTPTPTETPSPTPTATPTSTPTNTPTPAPTATPTPQVYTVVAGDTLSAIAANYGVTVETIAEANDLEDPGLILVGQELLIPTPATPGP